LKGIVLAAERANPAFILPRDHEERDLPRGRAVASGRAERWRYVGK